MSVPPLPLIRVSVCAAVPSTLGVSVSQSLSVSVSQCLSVSVSLGHIGHIGQPLMKLHIAMAVHPRLGFTLLRPATVLLVLAVAVTLVDLSPVVAQECESCPTGQYRLFECTGGVQPPCHCPIGFFKGDDGVCRPCVSVCEAGGFLFGECNAFTSPVCVMCAATDVECMSVPLSEAVSAARSAVDAAAADVAAATAVSSAANQSATLARIVANAVAARVGEGDEAVRAFRTATAAAAEDAARADSLTGIYVGGLAAAVAYYVEAGAARTAASATALVNLSPVVAQECEPCPTGQYRLADCMGEVQPPCYCSGGLFMGDDGVCRPCVNECEAGGVLVGECTAFTSPACMVCAAHDVQCASVQLSEAVSAARSGADAAATTMVDASAIASTIVGASDAAKRTADTAGGSTRWAINRKNDLYYPPNIDQIIADRMARQRIAEAAVGPARAYATSATHAAVMTTIVADYVERAVARTAADAAALVDLTEQECKACPTGQYRLATECTDRVQPPCYCPVGLFVGDDGVCRPCVNECEAGGYLFGECSAFTSPVCVMCGVRDLGCRSNTELESVTAARSAGDATADVAVAAAAIADVMAADARTARAVADAAITAADAEAAAVLWDAAAAKAKVAATAADMAASVAAEAGAAAGRAIAAGKLGAVAAIIAAYS